jgi:hypothetical protein
MVYHKGQVDSSKSVIPIPQMHLAVGYLVWTLSNSRHFNS